MFHLQAFNGFELTILGAYFAALGILAFYGFHRIYLVYLFDRYGKTPDPDPEQYFDRDELPVVTVQLPIFNEQYVVDRLIEAVCGLDYPVERLHIQVLDDSTDETTEIARRLVRQKSREGFDIELIHREDREGYKAGALENGLETARGQFVAIFDADFIPEPDFLRRTVHYFTDPDVGVVQARWDYVNRDRSLLTRAQAVLLDGHFVIEHTSRHRSGRFFNFNGTAGLWRRSAIEDAGGWEHDTLTEDLDLSYRAQLSGWNFIYLKDVTVPSELPVDINAFRAQQHRWTKGAVQTAIKVLPRILTSNLPFRVKYEAFQHLTANFTYVLMVLLSILMPPATWVRIHHGWREVLFLDLPVFVCATLSICWFYFRSQRAIGRKTWETLKLIPAVLGLGIGICINNARAVFEPLIGHSTPFVRTPKFADEGHNQRSWLTSLYRRKAFVLPALEISFGVWFTVAILNALFNFKEGMFSIPFLALFQMGFFYVGFLGVRETFEASFARGN